MRNDIFAEYLPRLKELVGSLRGSVESNDAQQVASILHTILGMSSEAGAHAICHQVRQVYVPLRVHGTLPADATWLENLVGLVVLTDRALQAYYYPRS